MFHTVVASSPMRQGRLSSFPMPPSMSRALALSSCPPSSHPSPTASHHHHHHHHHQHHHGPATSSATTAIAAHHYQMVHPPNIYQHYHPHRLPVPPPPYHSIGHHILPAPVPLPSEPPPPATTVSAYPDAIVEAPPGFTPMQVLCAVCCLRSHDKQETTFVRPVTKTAVGQSDVVLVPPHSYRPEEPLARPTSLTAVLEPRRMNKKKSSSGNSLKSPIVKRSDQSPVTMKGWLYKQGSEGLMLWKKRWFVLSDFCLFYYKGPDEDKILGSILLPSYNVSPCTTDDRIYRKFAFKAEHHNMRTYYFATETKKEMQQWMNAMSLASILQNNISSNYGHRDEALDRIATDLTSVGSVTGNDDEDSGFTSYHSRRPPSSPQQDGNSTLTDSYTSNDIYRTSRLEDSLHDSTSESSYPDGYLGSADKYPNPNYSSIGSSSHPHMLHAHSVHSNVFQQRIPSGPVPPPGAKQHLYANAPPKPKRMGGPSDTYMHSRDAEIMSPHPSVSHGPYLDYVEREEKVSIPHSSNLIVPGNTRAVSPIPKQRPEEYQGPVSSQRRTPDPYARAVPPPTGRSGHYSDEYAATIAAVAGQMHSQNKDEYAPSRRQPLEYVPLRTHRGLRPHSADFLEYDVYAEKVDVPPPPPPHQRRTHRSIDANQARPKSSVERYGMQDYGISEGEMASERQQPQRLQEIVNEHHSGTRTPHENIPFRMNMSFDSYLAKEASYGPLPSRPESRSQLVPSHAERLSSTPSTSMVGLETATGVTRHSNPVSAAVPPLSREEQALCTLPRDRSFIRSASARLPSATSMSSVSSQQQQRTDGRDESRLKVQQREESMKRLLEWKQRMLQSPLTKKYPSKSAVGALLLQQQHSHSLPSSAATTPSGVARPLPSKQLPPPPPHHQQQQILPQQLQAPGSLVLSSQQQTQQSPSQPDGSAVSSARLLSSEQYRKQARQELTSHETALQNQPSVQLRPESTMERPDRSIPHWHDKDLMKSRESQELTALNRLEKGSKTSRTPSRSPNRTQEHRRSTSSLNRYYNSYSSDDEESWSGSMCNQKENRLPLRPPSMRLPNKRRHRNDVAPTVGLKTVREDANVSDSEVQSEMKLQNVKLHKYLNERDADDHRVKLSISAGDLLGKTHEELILLLIQLRRDQAKLEQEMHKCNVELDAERKLSQFDSAKRGEHTTRQKQLIKQYEELAKQYELTKPLVNLVDNMVKLGSLYGGSEQMLASQYQLDRLPPQDYAPPKKMIEFSRRIQEQRLLEHERAEWDHLTSEQVDLQAKLQELCKLDQVLHEESYLVSGLQQDKDLLEKTVESLKIKLDGCRESPVELEKLQKQLRAAEKELTKIRHQLTQGTKKLEETAADNAKIENEILVLRQKVQASLKQGLSSGSMNEASHVKVQLEKELSRISNVMEDLAWKREELSGALEQLKDRNKALLADVRASPTGVAGSAALPGRKNHRSTYLETDLDTMETHDIIESWKHGDGIAPSSVIRQGQIPLYVNTYNTSGGLDARTLANSSIGEDVNASLEYVSSEHPEEGEAYKPLDISEADDKMKRFYGILPREKPAEIKTVRIVKRESERRSKGRDRRKTSYEGDPALAKVGEDVGDLANLDDVELTEEMLQFQRSMSLPRNYGRPAYLFRGPHGGPGGGGAMTLGMSTSTLLGSQQSSPNSLNLGPGSQKNVSYYYRTPSLSNPNPESSLSAHERLFGLASSDGGVPPSPSSTSPTLVTPAFKSEAARKIVAETAHELAATTTSETGDLLFEHDGRSRPQDKYQAGSLKRRQKRRHFTISSSQPLVLETVTQKMVHARSRDDLDIERCLRSSNTPDVVKSTIKKNDMFDESTIDRELGLPSKIVIPERYVEEEGEELSAAEQLQRIQKAESIRKMLSESTAYGDVPPEEVKSATLKKKFEAERKQREHLLALNQIIAKEVMERSKAVAASLSVTSDRSPQ